MIVMSIKHNLDEWFHYVTLFNFAFFQQIEIILQILSERKTKKKRKVCQHIIFTRPRFIEDSQCN
jgi:hypothetical protein